MMAPKPGWFLRKVLVTFSMLKQQTTTSHRSKKFTNIDAIVTDTGSKDAS